MLQDFTDDLIESSDVVSFLGKAFVDGKDCYHIATKSKDMSVQIWIADDAYFLPVRYAITHYRGTNSSQFEGSFSNFLISHEKPLFFCFWQVKSFPTVDTKSSRDSGKSNNPKSSFIFSCF